MDDHGTKYRRNIAENFNRLSRAHERYRRQADWRAIAYSERESELTFAKNLRSKIRSRVINVQSHSVMMLFGVSRSSGGFKGGRNRRTPPLNVSQSRDSQNGV